MWHPCMAVCLCPSYLISVATPCLECVHASVHVFTDHGDSSCLLGSGVFGWVSVATLEK